MKFKILSYEQNVFESIVIVELTMPNETITKTFQKVEADGFVKTSIDQYYELFEDGSIGSVQNLEPIFVKAEADRLSALHAKELADQTA